MNAGWLGRRAYGRGVGDLVMRVARVVVPAAAAAAATAAAAVLVLVGLSLAVAAASAAAAPSTTLAFATLSLPPILCFYWAEDAERPGRGQRLRQRVCSEKCTLCRCERRAVELCARLSELVS